MEYPICQKCGAAMGDKRLHNRWHSAQEQEQRTVIDRALRELDRRFQSARLGRPH